MSRHHAIEETTVLRQLGAEIRTRRKALRVNSTAAAEAAGVSRVTLHRIEKGEATVAIGAWVRVMAVLGLGFGAKQADEPPTQGSHDESGWIPASIRLDDYPQLKALAWHVQGVHTLRPKEAFDIYTRNARHLQTESMQQSERDLLDALNIAFAEPGHV